MGLGAVHRRRLRRAQLFVDLDKTLLDVVSLILFDGRLHSFVVAEEVENLGVAAHSEGAYERGDGELAVFVYAHIENVVDVGFIFEPRSAVGDDRCGIKLLTGFVVVHFIVNAG